MSFLPALIAAMIIVESSGDPGAVGDGGRALGCLQIHACVVADVNRVYKTSFAHADALDPDKAQIICRLYIDIYAPPDATPEQLARIWNGGPRGHLKSSTKKYWAKVEKHLAADSRQKQGGRK